MSKSYGKLEPGPNIHPTAEVFDSSFGAYTKIGAYSRIENAVYGDMSYSEAYVYVANARIGKYSNIAASVRIGPTAHPYHRPTLHHFTYRSDSYGWTEEREEAFFKERESRLAFIGHDTWIGHGAVIMPEVTLGHGSVVGAGAVATKDVPPYAIVGGVPARIMNYRFSLGVAEALLEIAWWDWPLETVRDRLEDFRGDTLAFVEKYSGS